MFATNDVWLINFTLSPDVYFVPSLNSQSINTSPSWPIVTPLSANEGILNSKLGL